MGGRRPAGNEENLFPALPPGDCSLSCPRGFLARPLPWDIAAFSQAVVGWASGHVPLLFFGPVPWRISGELHRIEVESGLWFPASLSCFQMSYLHYYIYYWLGQKFRLSHSIRCYGKHLWKNTGQPSISHESTGWQEISWFTLNLGEGGSGPLISPLLLGWGG